MRSRVCALAFVASAGLVFLPACGDSDREVATPGDDDAVEITMKDNRFDPDRIRVRTGQKVTIRFDNEGALTHEAYIGDERAQEEHEAEMTAPKELPGHDMGNEHGDADALRVEPGNTGSLEHTFDQTGTTLIGCHEPGHWAAGMRVRIEVT
jgi:uncharacterized cupredoxin-like copper-binding protein